MQNFPVTQSTLSAVHLCELLQDRYSLSSETSCKLFRTGMNHLYMVADGDNRHVFRVYTFNWHTRNEVSEEIRLLNHLKENGIPISYPIPDSAGHFIQDIKAPEGIRYAVLFSFAKG